MWMVLLPFYWVGSICAASKLLAVGREIILRQDVVFSQGHFLYSRNTTFQDGNRNRVEFRGWEQ